jgi:hypothetical protein
MLPHVPNTLGRQTAVSETQTNSQTSNKFQVKAFSLSLSLSSLSKLLVSFSILFLILGCGGDGSSNNNNGGSDFVADFMSDFPSLDTTAHALVYEYKILEYYDNSSSQLAKEFNASINTGDFTLFSSEHYDSNGFYYEYSLNNPASKDLTYAGIYIESYFRSVISMYLAADNRSIKTDEFTDIFGKIDADLLVQTQIYTRYEGDMSAKVAEYYANVTASGGFFDISGVDVNCDTDGVLYWYCRKYDGGVYYDFDFNAYTDYFDVAFLKYI